MKAARPNQHITIVGSGIAGIFLALMFAKRGYKVDIYEQLAKAEISDTNTKRSYNITLYKYGVDMLKKAELWSALKPYLIPLKNSSTQLAVNSKPVIIPVDHKKMQYYSLSRSGLLSVLLNQAEQNPFITTHYETSIVSIDRYAKTMTVHNTKTNKLTIVQCDVIFGADGVNSVVRPFIQQGKQTIHTQDYADWSYKQFVISAEWVAKFDFKLDTAYTWSRKNACITSFPNKDGSLAALLVLPLGKDGFSELKTEKVITELFSLEFPDLLPLVPDIAEQILQNPEGSFVTVHTDPWYYKDFMVLLGDAAHGFYPFFGQGTSAAFGDSAQIIELTDKYGPDWEKIFPLYQAKRKEHMDTLGEVSRIGFQKYLRSKRGDRSSIYDYVESVTHGLLPSFVKAPLYYNVITDPDNTATHFQEHKKQRHIARFMGIPTVITTLAGVILLHEFTMTFIKKISMINEAS